MTQSREYQEADKFKRYLLREIKAGGRLADRGMDDPPLDLCTLQAVKAAYDKLHEEKIVITGPGKWIHKFPLERGLCDSCGSSGGKYFGVCLCDNCRGKLDRIKGIRPMGE